MCAKAQDLKFMHMVQSTTHKHACTYDSSFFSLAQISSSIISQSSQNWHRVLAKEFMQEIGAGTDNTVLATPFFGQFGCCATEVFVSIDPLQ